MASKLPTPRFMAKGEIFTLFSAIFDSFSKIQPSIVAHFLLIKGMFLDHFSYIGQFPTIDGLFAASRLAYFSALPLNPESVRPKVEFVVP